MVFNGNIRKFLLQATSSWSEDVMGTDIFMTFYDHKVVPQWAVHAKLTYITWLTVVYGRYNELVNGVYTDL